MLIILGLLLYVYFLLLVRLFWLLCVFYLIEWVLGCYVALYFCLLLFLL